MTSMANKNLPGVTIEVAPESVPMHMASGWVPLDGKATEAAEAAEKADADQKAKDDEAAKNAIDAEEKKAAASAKAKTAAKES